MSPLAKFKTKGEWIAAKRDVTFVWRKMEHKQPIKISGKAVLTAVVGIVGMGKYDLRHCCRSGWHRYTDLPDSIVQRPEIIKICM